MIAPTSTSIRIGEELLPPRPGVGTKALTLARRKPLGALSLAFIILLTVVAIFRAQIATADPLTTSPIDKLLSPSAQHFFGTDELGRDVFSRMVYGARTALIAGLLATIAGVSAGSAIGLVTGYAGGWIDSVLQRLMDAVLAIPGLILLLALVSILRPSLFNIVIALAILITPSTSRVVRGTVLSTKENLYIEAARALGAGHMRLMLRHILPNVMAPIIVMASVTVGNAILIEASLSFLGLGVPPPNPTWGSMLAVNGRRFIEQQPWLGFFPGMAIALTVLSANFLGDALRDVLDPRLRGSR